MSASSSSSNSNFTPVSEIPTKVQALRDYFGTHATKSATWRKTQLRACLRLMEENEQAIASALKADLSKPSFEATFAEVVAVETEIRSLLDQLDDWMKPVSYPTPAALLPGDSYVIRDPYGIVLIIAPFNYPVQLSMLPLIAAISGGNCCVLKPSELTPASTALLQELIPRYLDQRAFQVVTGAVAETTALLQQKWDYIFFTGSDMVGKIVARAAAENLTPVTLELGGKSPVIIGPDADLPLAARRVLWGKCYNAGQSCIAPDYVFVHTSIQNQFQEECKKVLKQFFADDAIASPDYARIVNDRHSKRIASLIDSTPKEDIIVGGRYDINQKYVEPTVVRATTSSPVMREEIFGPILPIIAYDDITTVLSHINANPKPLALYIFSTNTTFNKRILNETSSGGVSINDVMMHFANPHLPFGGVGTSGQGRYHGKHGYETFTHPKAVLNKSIYGDAPARYPPYTAMNAKIFRFFSEMYRLNSTTFTSVFKYLILPAIVAIVLKRAGVTVGFKSNL